MQRDELADGPDANVTTADVDRAVAEANSAFPALKVTRDDITLVHRANVPAERGSGGRAQFLGSSQLRDHSTDGVAGAMTVVGVKFTTARATASRVADAAVRILGKSASRRVDTQSVPLPGAAIADHEALAIETARAVHLELAPPIIRHLTAIYGDRCAPIVRLMAERSEWRMPLVPGRPNVGAEVIHAIRAEMACTLADIVVRRTELGAAGNPGAEVARAAGQVAAEELNWDVERLNREMAAVEAIYRLP
jgi:glycerol-3-phosphate dehydrogenase